MNSSLRHIRIPDDLWATACKTLPGDVSPTQLVVRLLEEHVGVVRAKPISQHPALLPSQRAPQIPAVENVANRVEYLAGGYIEPR